MDLIGKLNFPGKGQITDCTEFVFPTETQPLVENKECKCSECLDIGIIFSLIYPPGLLSAHKCCKDSLPKDVMKRYVELTYKLIQGGSV